MKPFFRTCAAPATLAAAMLMASAPAGAQPADQPQPGGAGPMTVAPIRSEWVIGPEAKVTHFDGQTDTLLGVSGGKVIDEALFLGAAGYWLTDTSHFHKLGYGGIVVEWREGTDRAIGYSLRGLLGFGSATVSGTALLRSGPLFDDSGHAINPPPPLTPVRVGYRRDFSVAEPEADLLVNFSKHARLRTGVGYRATGDTRGVGDRISGVTGIVSLEIGTAGRRP